MPNVSKFGAQTDNAVVSGTVTDRQTIIPDVPPQGLMSVGPRVTPNYIKEPWSALNSYVYFDVVRDVAGSSYVAIKPLVPAGTELTDEDYWFKWSDPNAQLDELEQIVKLYDGRISQNASAITAEEQRATAAEATKAPTGHASEETVYGVGNAVNYGHVKVADTGASDASASVAASPKYVSDVKTELTDKMTTELSGYYTKSEADGRFVAKSVKGDPILACVGDSILAGWSKEHPNNIPAWDTYLGNALGFREGDIYKYAIGGAGFDSDTKIANEVNTLKNNIESAGRNLEDVSIVVLGAGINDVINKRSASAVKSGAELAVTNACNAFPSAEIHIFPMVMGWANLCGLMLELESAINDGAMNVNAKNKIVTHAGVWSWNYDGNDSGVSSDGIHLLAGGESKAGRSMAIEINGGSAYREGYQFDITNAQGKKVVTGHRRGATVSFKLASNFTSIATSGDNATLGLHPRYCVNSGCVSFSRADQAKNVIMFCDHKKGYFNSYEALNDTGVYGNACYAIENTP